MNPPIQTTLPDDIDIDIDIGSDAAASAYRPAHAAHARLELDDVDEILDLTDRTNAADEGERDATIEVVRPSGIEVIDEDITIIGDTVTSVATSETPVIGARAAARAARRRRSDRSPAVDVTNPEADPTELVTWQVLPDTIDAAATGTVQDMTSSVASDGLYPHDQTASLSTTAPVAERDPMRLIRTVDEAWTATTCWVRRHASAQLALPCLIVIAVGLTAVIAAEGAAERIGQIAVTAALVTAGAAWSQAIGDQRRRQQDLRFRLASGNLEQADLTGTVLDGFTLWGQNLRGAKLSGCSADHVLLSGADLREASMTGASLRVASMTGADLTDARLYRGDLRGADLTAAIAIRASFEGAVLRGALLEGADLTGADLSGADLRGATHDDRTCWDGVVVTDETHLPEGVLVP